MFSVTEQLRPDLHQEDTTKIIRHSKSYNYYYNDQYIYIKQFKRRKQAKKFESDLNLYNNMNTQDCLSSLGKGDGDLREGGI